LALAELIAWAKAHHDPELYILHLKMEAKHLLIKTMPFNAFAMGCPEINLALF
jgi:hypothetical protein